MTAKKADQALTVQTRYKPSDPVPEVQVAQEPAQAPAPPEEQASQDPTPSQPSQEPQAMTASHPFDRPIYYARRGPFTYAKKRLGRGQILQMRNPLTERDQVLIHSGIVGTMDPKEEPVQCGLCGEWFMDARCRSLHGTAEHAPRPEDWTAEDEDRQFERQMRQVNQEAPLLNLTPATA